MADNDKSVTPELAEIRRRINEIDERLQSLINERAKFAQQVGVAKGELMRAVDYYRPEREAEVLRAVKERNLGPLRDEEMLRLFREIMSACLAQQEPLKVGFLGPEGTFTQTAVYKHFGHSVRALPFHTIDEVFREVAAEYPQIEKWKAEPRISGSCPSKIRRRGPSTTRSTCS